MYKRQGLLLAIGFVIGGTGGILTFAVIAVVFNFAMYWFLSLIHI